MCSLWLFTFLLLLMTCSVKGSSYCMTDCDSNSHKPSLYLQYCCDLSNRGKLFKIQDEIGHKNYILCPSVPPFVNMSEPGSFCPSGLVQYNNIFNTSLCWITGKTSYYSGCNSAFFSTYFLNYTKVCGQVRGYQYGFPYAFECYIFNSTDFIPQIKTYGITLTYSNNPRKHIWTYAGGENEQQTGTDDCPCNNGSPRMNFTIPFVGSNYYCESGTNSYSVSALYSNDPLWDGQDCPEREATCCTFPKMPWFVKILNGRVSDNIELISCGTNNRQDVVSGIPFDLVELYIK